MCEFDVEHFARQQGVHRYQHLNCVHHLVCQRLDGWIKPDDDDGDGGTRLVTTDARFNPYDDGRLKADDTKTGNNPWHAFGRNTFRTKRLSHFSSYFTVRFGWFGAREYVG